MPRAVTERLSRRCSATRRNRCTPASANSSAAAASASSSPPLPLACDSSLPLASRSRPSGEDAPPLSSSGSQAMSTERRCLRWLRYSRSAGVLGRVCPSLWNWKATHRFWPALVSDATSLAFASVPSLSAFHGCMRSSVPSDAVVVGSVESPPSAAASSISSAAADGAPGGRAGHSSARSPCSSGAVASTWHPVFTAAPKTPLWLSMEGAML
mmetsp:Transcript_36889/g.102398  ORF Transcript_36889/g.102398 Transcript_36889/m.102398 type:complete len:212 (+) Transcript_36889:365-1000(+)